MEKETNEYKRNALESELRSVEDAKELLTHFIQSLQGELSSCEGTNGRNPEWGRVAKTTLQSAWQVLKVAFLFPSPPKLVLVKEVWNRVRGRLVPPSVRGTVPIRDS